MLDREVYRTKKYLHFDHRVKIGNAESYVTNPLRIEKHSFLPLIHYVSSFEKNIGVKNPDYDDRPVKPKNRDIMYAGHWDNFIYKYYSEKLNDGYNEYLTNVNMNECITAYRNNMPGKSNIDFAAEIINEIVHYEDAYILVGDFTNYFDKIDHFLLKELLKKVLNTNWLDKDWFNVFRSVTKYGYYEKDFLNEVIGSDRELKAQKKKSYFDQISDFRIFQKKHSTETNEEKYGIPQGTAISAVFANVYALNFDLELKKIADNYQGLYRRYSDDFVLIMPKKSVSNDNEIWKIEKSIRELSSRCEIIIQEDKTGLYSYKNQKIIKLDDSKIKRLDYLGFIFDGRTVKMRGKSPYKFYRKSKQLVQLAQSRKEEKSLKHLPYRKSIYGLYTDLGTSSGEFGNFISYAKRAQKKFDVLSPNTQNMMMKQIKNRKTKLEKMLGIRIHTRV